MHTQTFEIPEEYIGLIIGKKGKTIRKIKELFDVKIKLEDKQFIIESKNSLSNVRFAGNYMKQIYQKKACEEQSCPVCLDIIEDKNSVVTECGHKFHFSCLQESLKSKNSCPMCRKKIGNHKKMLTESQKERIINETIRHSIHNGTFYMMVYYMSTDSYIHCNSVSAIREMIRMPLKYALDYANLI